MIKGQKVSSFILNELIGKGGFGEVWAATSVIDHIPVAIKIELINPESPKNILKEESRVLAKISDSPCFPHYIQYWEERGYAFLAMELLESTVKKTTEAAFDGRLSLKQGSSLAIQMLADIQSLHAHGFIHRDIKPSNFMYRPGNSPPDVCLIDFGMAKLWRDVDGNSIPPRNSVGFRGTCRYASLNSHEGLDLSCRDDIWSFFYILVEMVAPPLPWHNQSSKDVVAQIKQSSNSRIVIGLPPQFQEILDHILTLKFADEPNYDFLFQKLREIKEIGEADDAKLHAANSNRELLNLANMPIVNCKVDHSYNESSSSMVFSDADAPLFSRNFSKGPMPRIEKERVPSDRTDSIECPCLLI